MNLEPVAITEIPIGRPLPWQIYDRDGYVLFARGEVIASRQLLESWLADGLFRDVDHLLEGEEAAWVEFKGLPPGKMFPPHGVRPQVWERVQLRLLGTDIQTCYYAHLIGYIKDQSILVTTPIAHGQRIIMADGERLEVRMLTGRNIVVFQSEVMRVCVSPSFYMHLQYPSMVRMQKLRSVPRARMSITATVTSEEGVEEIAQIIDLSSEGAQVNIPRNVGGKGQFLRISFQARVDELKTTLTLKGLIQHARPARPGLESGPETLEYGIAFPSASASDRLWLKCVVYQHIAEASPV